MIAELKRIECFPNNAVPFLMRITEPVGRNSYELMFSYHHSKLVQLGQVKVFRNDEPVEYVSVATMEGAVTFEVIAEGGKAAPISATVWAGRMHFTVRAVEHVQTSTRREHSYCSQAVPSIAIPRPVPKLLSYCGLSGEP